jgi:hypothetical protein
MANCSVRCVLTFGSFNKFGPGHNMEVIQQAKKNVIIDASILSTLMGCPRLADFRYNHNLMAVDGKSNSLECGSIVHKYLEKYYKALSEKIPRIEAHQIGMNAARLYISGCAQCSLDTTDVGDKPECGHARGEFPGVKNTPADNEKGNGERGARTGWKWVLETCQQYYDHYHNDHWIALETEIVKGEILYENDDLRVLWKAKLDLTVDTNQGIYPVDHKTMKQRRDKISLNNQFIGQCLLMQTRSMIINKIGFQTSLEPKEKFTREVVSYSSDRLIEWQSEILPYYAYKLLDYTENSHWPPNFTHCENAYGKCQFIRVCEADRSLRGEELRLHFAKTEPWNPSNIETEV